MKTSPAGLNAIKLYEGTRLTAYLCSAGVPTIGVGHTDGVRMGDTITQAQADEFLRLDVVDSERAVSDLVKVPLTQAQFDSLVSFVFNLGRGAFAGSTLLRKLNAGNYDGAAGEFEKWVRAGGRVIPGLVKRRHAEAAMFQGEVQ